MGKNNKKRPPAPEEPQLFLTAIESSREPIVDTHTHLLSTFSAYRSKYPAGKYKSVFDFVRGAYEGKNVEAMVDVYCEAPVQSQWRELADSAIMPEDRMEKWSGTEYWFVMGVHPHEAKDYTDTVEAEILEAMNHPRNVGWGEIGLDYHYDLSPRDVQRQVFARQLEHAVRLGKPLTIHTREAEEDTERILKEIVPKGHKIHVHCFTDTPEFAQRLLDHYPNLHIGITGVITYSTNTNTSDVIRNLVRSNDDSTSSGPLRILLETDAPYMVPNNIYKAFPELKSGTRFPICHTAMIPWTADFVAGVASEAGVEYDRDRVMRESRENARKVYGV
ncbi:Metallo-dependent hydrolase [Fomitiporia mediterranea MF3/22]|uniref:Metallo-dependent hydrolase n=1 Tax=Fomitiporia mediterranea (strain MF3/22) TaxID=694068 RepID=UPI0004407347|nr:Metallo-dependent hydrolase [Fomitiporia mediterranea MF3/22]EJC99451.1 Metallo-dependent hydrolase [Fomitiporia mediterranea MF3/22]